LRCGGVLADHDVAEGLENEEKTIGLGVGLGTVVHYIDSVCDVGDSGGVFEEGGELVREDYEGGCKEEIPVEY
jgi:hypothetical protein